MLDVVPSSVYDEPTYLVVMVLLHWPDYPLKVAVLDVASLSSDSDDMESDDLKYEEAFIQ